MLKARLFNAYNYIFDNRRRKLPCDVNFFSRRLRRLTVTNKFKSSVLMGGYLIRATYYLAQYGIAIGFLREKLGDK